MTSSTTTLKDLERRLAEAEARADRLAVLDELGHAIGLAKTEAEFFRTTAAFAPRIFPSVARASVALLAPPGDHVEVIALEGHAGAAPVGTRFPTADTMMGQVVQRACVVLIDGDLFTKSDLRDVRMLADQGYRSTMDAPLIAGGEVLGTLNTASRNPNGYTPDDQGLLLRVASLLAAHVGRWRLIARLEAANADLERRVVERTAEIERLRRRLEIENAYLREEVLESQAFGDILGQSQAVRELVQQIGMVARTDATVLVLGESGTGKELVAREIHRRSRRAERPMIKVNCASIPRELYESEFFGHVRGAFTGAVKDRVGRFTAADGGTLFLDEVGEIPIELQAKLLRVLQEGTYERVGEEHARTADVRIVAATNRDLRAEIAAGRFRQDLYYRLNVFPIQVAPLRERKEDIPLLVARFVDLAARKLGQPRPDVTREGLDRLGRHGWPGNVRELQNVVERAIITAQAGRLRFDLPDGGVVAQASQAEHEAPGAGEVLTDAEMRRRERENVIRALERAGWQISGPGGAAELLEIRPTTLMSRLKAMGIRRPGGAA